MQIYEKYVRIQNSISKNSKKHIVNTWISQLISKNHAVSL